ncbi:MAG: SurA N-terminal domain-containing protein [Anaerolineae bacterium]|jgi:parvulin-like peptidyl-prolyl isomerase
MAKRSQKRKNEEAKRQTKKQLAIGRREARQNRIIMFSLAAVAVVVVLILAVGLVQELLIEPNRPVARVNGNDIPSDFYQDTVNFQRYNLYSNLAQLQDAVSSLQGSEENDFLVQFYQQQISQIQQQVSLIPETALDGLIDDELIREKAEEEGITVTDQEVEAEIDQLLRQSITPPQETVTGTTTLPTPTPVAQDTVDEYYDTLIENMMISKGSFEEMVRRDMLRQRVQALLAEQVPTTGLIAHVQIIQTETEEEALAAKLRIEGGEDFALVAQEVSTDTLSVEDGGDLGWVATGQLASRYGQEVEDAVFGQEVDELTVVESGGMFFLIQVLERDENGPLPEEVLQLQQNSALDDWLVERKESPDVEIERLLEPSQIPEDPFLQQQVVPG